MTRKVLLSAAAAALLALSGASFAQTAPQNESVPGQDDASANVPGTPRAEREGAVTAPRPGATTQTTQEDAANNESVAGKDDASAGVPGTPRAAREGDAPPTTGAGSTAPPEEPGPSESVPGHDDASDTVPGTPREESR